MNKNNGISGNQPSAQRLKSHFTEGLCNAIACPLFFINSDGIFTGCNIAFADLIVGLCINEIIGKSPTDLKERLPDDLAAMPVKAVLENIRQCGQQRHETAVACTDSRTRHFAIHTSAFSDPQGQAAGIVGLMLDITAAKASEAELIQYRDTLEERVAQRSAELIAANHRLSQEIKERRQDQIAGKALQERYRQIFENTGTATILVEPDMTISMANVMAEKLMGIPREQFVGRTKSLDFVAPAHRERLRLYHELSIQGDPNAPRRFEFQSIDAHGRVRDLLASTAFIPETRQVVASMLDITKSNQAHKERQQLAAVIDQSTEAVIITDTHGRVEYVNHAFTELCGYSLQECTDQTLDAPFFSDQDRTIFKQMTFTLTGKETWSGRIENLRKDGHRYIADTRIFPICDDREKAVNLVCVKRDVTHEVQLEKQLQHTQKMEAIGTLAGGIAHDFNNILGGILGYTEICRLKTGSDELLQRYLGRILDGCQRAKELVGNILAFSRKHTDEAKPIDVQMIVKEALKLLRASIPSTIEFKRQISSNPGIVLATPTQIHQVIMNLCTNAAQAMQEKGGQLSVSLANVDLSPKDCIDQPQMTPGPHICLTISDTGPGMSPTTLNRIFEPYFTTKAQTGGTGLGLAMVHGIVKTAGGNLTVSSQLGRGSTFVVHLPRVAESTQPQRPAKEEIPRGTESVLVVDDELFIIEILSDMLKSAGYRAEAVNSSTEALQLFRDNPDRFDLVIADYTMPKITGIVLAKEIKALRPDMPVVLTTGLTFDDATDKETLSNFAAILKKPILYKDLAITLRNVLDDATCGK